MHIIQFCGDTNDRVALRYSWTCTYKIACATVSAVGGGGGGRLAQSRLIFFVTVQNVQKRKHSDSTEASQLVHSQRTISPKPPSPPRVVIRADGIE